MIESSRPPMVVATGHTKRLSFVNGLKTFPLCTNCNSEQTFPKHLRKDEFNPDRIDDENLMDTNLNEDVLRNAQCAMRPIDCEELRECGFAESGIYRIFPQSRVNSWGNFGFDVYCDMVTDGGGWTVFQRRDDFGTTSDFFFKGWSSYKFGFGDLNYDFWLGNDKIFALSNQRRSALRFDLMDFEGEDGYATYDNFYVDDESQAYRLHLGDYRGTIGDSFKAHNLCKFSTRDRDNDNSPYQNCALLYKGGWWYNNCHTVNLNGLYLKGQHDTYADGVNWYGWKGFRYSLRKTEMKIRSSTFFSKPFNGGDTMPPAPIK
ncbi:techylectin-5A [Caerostris extrusa]|uniref:Techylectin-5A n=1 Tax=Caerostris extrusa TaxID=172846 RepID=A0AAV4Y8P0_CAEEX|nr:techylectin-5A [Caerostris extrusa]